MELILWRHAEAEDATGDMRDLDRQLTPRGRKQARRMAIWLEQVLPASCRILVSPARRTVQTADALGRKYRLCEDIAPDAAPEALLAAAGWPDGKGPVLLVGHQPTLGETAALLLTGTTSPLSIRKGCVWWIASREDGKGNVLRAVVSPDLARK